MFKAIFTLALVAVSLVNGSSAPSASPTASPTTSAPSRSPTYQLSFLKQVCPTQTAGIETGVTLITGAAPDGNDFVGIPSQPFMLGRGNITALVYQSTSPQKVILQFGVTYTGSQIRDVQPYPNMTFNPTLYGLVNDTTFVALRAAIYAPREIAVLYTTSANMKMKVFNVSNSYLYPDVDTGLTTADQTNHIRLIASYYIVAASNTAYKIQRSIITTIGGVRSAVFLPVAYSTSVPKTMLVSAFDSQVDARGLIVMAFQSTAGFLTIASYNTSSINNLIEVRNNITLPGSSSTDTPLRITIVSPAANTFLLAYADNAASVASQPNRIIVIYTTSGFTSVTFPLVVGNLVFPKTSSISLSVLFTSNRTVNIFEFNSPANGLGPNQVWGLPWIWNRNNETAVFNSTYGRWASAPLLVFNTSTPWSAARVSGQTSFGFNIVADSQPAVVPRVIQTSQCLVYSFVNTTRRSSAAVSQVSMVVVALILGAIALVA